MNAGDMSGKWRYAFDCKDCGNKKTINGTTFCIPLHAGRDPLKSEGYVLNCDEYKPRQFTLFERDGRNDFEGRTDKNGQAISGKG